MTLIEIRNRIEQKKGQKDLFLKKKQNLENNLNKLMKEKLNIENALTIIQAAAQKTQKEINVHISPLVSSALSIVYDDPYEFNIKFEPKRGKIESIPVFERENDSRIPGYETGEGPVDVASFGLILSLWCLNKNKIRNTLIFDEPFKNLDEFAISNAVKMIKILSKELKKNNLQFIIITHNKKEFLPIADTIHEIKKTK